MGGGTLSHGSLAQAASHSQRMGKGVAACLNGAYAEPSPCSPRPQDTKTVYDEPLVSHYLRIAETAQISISVD